MDFFGRQDEARRRTTKLLVLMALAILFTTLGVYGIVMTVKKTAQSATSGPTRSRHVLNAYRMERERIEAERDDRIRRLRLRGMLLPEVREKIERETEAELEALRARHGLAGGTDPATAPGWWDGNAFFWSFFGVVAVVGGASAIKTAALDGGGGKIARMLGGREVNPGTKDPRERRLLNLVEEMAIASGVPVPEVYVLDDEKGINAFAAGFTTSDAAVAVTHGTLRLLSRDELQGVIAHEFSHILNGDMRLNVRLMGIVFGLLMLAVTGRVILRGAAHGSGRDGRAAAAMFTVGFGLLIVGSIGLLFGRMIKSAVSRQREYLADASAVQFTRNPSGLAGALKKIGGYSLHSRIGHGHAEETSHMFFGEGMRSASGGLLSTHPPIEDRIRRIEPTFPGYYEIVAWPKEEPEPTAVDAAGMLLGTEGAAAPTGPAATRTIGGFPAGILTDRIGNLDPEILIAGQALLAALGGGIREAARDTDGARALVYAALLDPDDAVRTKQETALDRRLDPETRARVERLRAEVARSSADPLALVDLAVPALKRMPEEAYREMIETIDAVIHADAKVDLLEFVIAGAVRRHVGGKFDGVRKGPSDVVSLAPLRGACRVLLSAIAYHGHPDDPEGAARAYVRGLAEVRGTIDEFPMLPREECGMEAFGEALEKTARGYGGAKKRILEACAQAAASDGMIDLTESRLIRAVADALDCPMPPLQAA